MTTIVYREGLLAADTLATFDGFKRPYRQRKIWHLRAGLVGLAGDPSYESSLIRALESGSELPAFDEFTIALLVDPKERLYIIQQGRMRQVEAPFLAIGSGAAPALGALWMNADAKRAVEIACQVDCFSALPIDLLDFDSPLRSAEIGDQIG